MTTIHRCDRCQQLIESTDAYTELTRKPMGNVGAGTSTWDHVDHLCTTCTASFSTWVADRPHPLDQARDARRREAAGVTVRRGMFENGPAA